MCVLCVRLTSSSLLDVPCQLLAALSRVCVDTRLLQYLFFKLRHWLYCGCGVRRVSCETCLVWDMSHLPAPTLPASSGITQCVGDKKPRGQWQLAAAPSAIERCEVSGVAYSIPGQTVYANILSLSLSLPPSLCLSLPPSPFLSLSLFLFHSQKQAHTRSDCTQRTRHQGDWATNLTRRQRTRRRSPRWAWSCSCPFPYLFIYIFCTSLAYLLPLFEVCRCLFEVCRCLFSSCSSLYDLLSRSLCDVCICPSLCEGASFNILWMSSGYRRLYFWLM